MSQWWTTYRRPVSIAILVILHVVGLFGLGSEWQSWFLALTPLTLLISAVLLLANHRDWSLHFGLLSLGILVTGFLVEVLGVHTGDIFGEYQYGATLGLQLWEVPLIIGVNWLLLVYATGTISARLGGPLVLKAALAAGLMTVLDMLIEPVAVAYDFWTWEGGEIPLQNYAGWFVIAFVLLLAFHALKFEKNNQVGVAVYAVQFAFFGCLNFMI